ncbi:unnamed protein product [Mycena citricolor]|uniref:Zn(2)-C6 fungal-type domain-containing protein n=1 Tax=Mycena citricolor TaxID=2018698 RepID=A0AAD2H2S1_9AGAR|nr:unnamed protein product [Mycena citricolor]
MSDEVVIPGSKKRRLRGSCDICKRRKIRCDSAEMPGGRCSNCIAFNSECTHDNAKRKTVPGKNPLQENAALMNRSPEEHVAAIIQHTTGYIKDEDVRRVLLNVAHYARGLERDLENQGASPSNPSLTPPPADFTAAEGSQAIILKQEEEEPSVDGVLTERFERFTLDTDANRYFGKSSHYQLIDTAINVSEMCVRDNPKASNTLPPVKRSQFWDSQWEHEDIFREDERPPLLFPEPDLMHQLISIYFLRINTTLGLIHRPTFERSFALGLHLSDFHFGSVVLAICALASKYTDDPRVLYPGADSLLSSGWIYFRQIRPTRSSARRAINLYEAQTICLYVIYSQGSSTPETCWDLAGLAIRYAQDVGIHRRNRFEDKFLDEQWKRVFWVFLAMDALCSNYWGRPRATTISDYDLDYPVECDDDYWDSDPGASFQQPPGKLTYMSYVIAYVKLLEILGEAQNTIYLVKSKAKSAQAVKDTVANLDSSLNKWVANVPEHLRWDPKMEDPLFSVQSAILHISYYHIQIQVHRIFVVIPRVVKTMSSDQCNRFSWHSPSLVICINAARACGHIAEIAVKKGMGAHPHVLFAVFDSCVLLLMALWAGRNVGLTVDYAKMMRDVDICLSVLKTLEEQWHLAGRERDIICELMIAANMDTSLLRNLPRPINDMHTPGMSSASSGSSQESSPLSVPAGEPMYPELDLPLYTQDLQKPPLYDAFSWTDFMDATERGVGSMNAAPAFFSGGYDAGLAEMDMFAGPPSGSNWGDWNRYISNVEQMMGSGPAWNTGGMDPSHL